MFVYCGLRLPVLLLSIICENGDTGYQYFKSQLSMYESEGEGSWSRFQHNWAERQLCQQPKLCCNYSKDGWNSCSAPLRCKKLKTLCLVANIDSKQKSTSSHFTLRMLLNMESSESLLNSLSVFAMLNYISLSILFICSGRITGIFGKTDILKIG